MRIGNLFVSKPMINKILLFIFLQCLGYTVLAQPSQNLSQLLSRIAPSTVKISSANTTHSGTGFVWNSRNHVVTALHVISGSNNNIRVYYPHLGQEFNAHVVKVLQDADLALLRVENAPDVQPLLHTNTIPAAGIETYCLGFEIHTPMTQGHRSLRIKFGNLKLIDFASKHRSLIIRNGYPSIDLDIITFENNSLIPGLSGAPIFDLQGNVIGIGDGGLEEGAVNVSWAIPAQNLTRLLNSTETSLPQNAHTALLFSSDLDANMGTPVTSGSFNLINSRTRSLLQLASFADDQLGLIQLSTLFSEFNPNAFEYDVFVDNNTGGTVCLPKGSTLTSLGHGAWKVDLEETNGISFQDEFEIYVMMRSTTSMEDAQNQSVNFELQFLNNKFPQLFWQVDPQWTNMIPVSRLDGLGVRRKAALGNVLNGTVQEPSHYAFEALAIKNNVFLGVVIINKRNTHVRAQQIASCINNAQNEECHLIREARRKWAQTVLGIQLSSFSM